MAVIAVFRRLHVPNRLATIVQSEALLNDAVAVVTYRAIAAAIFVSGAAAPVLRAAAMALAGAVLGVTLGAALAILAAFALRDRVASPLQSLTTLAGAYAVYFAADRLGWSGIFAVIAFGIALRELERHRISVAAARGVATFWEVLAAGANAVLFFLVGAALDPASVARAAPAAGIAIVAVVLSRIALAHGLLRLVRSQMRDAWQSVVRTAGIRGALSLALALATPAASAQRGIVIAATFAVVIVTILAAALTIEQRLRHLPLERAE